MPRAPFARRMRGRAWVFPRRIGIDTEILTLDILAEMKKRRIPRTEEELGRMCMVGVDPEFPKKVSLGDFIIAGPGTGYSIACLDGMAEDPHDLAYASRSILGAGVAAILCESCTFPFLRNSLDNGLPVVQCRGITEKVNQGDELEVDLEAGVVRNLGSGAELRFTPLPPFILAMIEAGGVYAQLRAQKRSGRADPKASQRHDGT